MKYIIILAILLMFLPDIYIWFQFVRGRNIIWSILYGLPLVITLLVMLIGITGHHTEAMMKVFFFLILSIAVPKFLFAVCSIVGKGAGLILPPFPIVDNIAGSFFAVLAFGASVYSFSIGWKRLVVKDVTIEFSDLPSAFDGYRIVQLSDLHIGTYRQSPESVKRLVKQVNELKPDIILFTGDLVNTTPEELDFFMKDLSWLEAKDGVYSILGNHDYCIYRRYDNPQEQQENLEEVKRREKELGWDLLLNEHRIIRCGTDSIALLGVENDGKPPFPSRADLPKTAKGLPDHIFKILMSHDPTHWKRTILPETDIQLTLSGHTHAMQLKIGSFSPSKWFYPEWGGLYEQEGRKLYVSTGAGSNVPFRFGAWPEIVMIRLKKGPDKR